MVMGQSSFLDKSAPTLEVLIDFDAPLLRTIPQIACSPALLTRRGTSSRASGNAEAYPRANAWRGRWRFCARRPRPSMQRFPLFANKLEWLGGDRWRLAFPHARSDCHVGGANCKCSHARRPRQWPRIVIGDGRSDFCMSAGADYVLAKGTLAEYCRSRGRAYALFANFNDVTARLSAWLARVETTTSTAPSTLISA